MTQHANVVSGPVAPPKGKGRTPGKPAPKPNGRGGAQGQKAAGAKPGAPAAKAHPPASGQQQKPAAKPPARANTPTNQPTQLCPVQTKPCDVQKFTVRAQVLGDDGKDRVLKTAMQLRGQALSKKVSPEVAAYLNRYDLVIDVVAGYPSKEDSSPDKVKIMGYADWHGSACSKHVHPLITLRGLNHIEELKKSGNRLQWKAKQSEPRHFWARSLFWDTQQHDNKLGAIFDIITSLWPGSHQKLIEVAAHGCGHRAPNGGKPIRELAALIRIFRNDTWSIVLKLPPLGKYSHERAATRNLATREVERSRTTSSSTAFNRNQSSTSQKTTSQGGQVTQRENSGSSHRGNQGSSYWNQRGQHEDGKPFYHSKEQNTSGTGREVYSTKGYQFNWLLPDKIKKPSGFMLSLKRNGTEIDIAGIKEILESIVKVAELIKEGFESLKRLPQIGWKVTFSISVLEGSITGTWGPKMIDAAIDGRYLPVRTSFNLEINVMLISVSVEVSFGVEAMALGTGVIIKLSGTISCKVPLKVNVAGTDPFEVKLTPAVECELKVIAYASVVGLSIVDVQVSVTGGITVDGKFVVNPQRGVRLQGEVKRNPIVVKGHVKWPMGPPKPFKPIEVLKGATIAKL